MTDLPNIDPSQQDPELDPEAAPLAPDGIQEPDPGADTGTGTGQQSDAGSVPGAAVPEGTDTEGADETLTEDRAARIPVEDEEPGAEDGAADAGAALPGAPSTEDPEAGVDTTAPADIAASADIADPEDAAAPDVSGGAWEPGASGPTGTGIEGADQALADDFADPSESVDDDRTPLRDVFDTEDTPAAEQENREGDETALDTDDPSQGISRFDEG